jgi:hypothetical protein
MAGAVRAHGLGLLPAAVNAAYKFLATRMAAMSQVGTQPARCASRCLHGLRSAALGHAGMPRHPACRGSIATCSAETLTPWPCRCCSGRMWRGGCSWRHGGGAPPARASAPCAPAWPAVWRGNDKALCSATCLLLYHLPEASCRSSVILCKLSVVLHLRYPPGRAARLAADLAQSPDDGTAAELRAGDGSSDGGGAYSDMASPRAATSPLPLQQLRLLITGALDCPAHLSRCHPHTCCKV